jgi:hypothetical protein
VDRDNTHRKSLLLSMNISKMYEDSVDSIKKTYNDTQLNPFKYPEKIKVELVINYKESLKTLDIEQLKKIFKLVKKEVNKELK